MIRDDIKAATITAMKSGDKETTGTLRLVQAAIKNRDIEARTGGARFGRCGAEQLGGVSVAHGAIGGVHGEQHAVENGKPYRAGVDAFEHRRPAAFWGFMQQFAGVAQVRFA